MIKQLIGVELTPKQFKITTFRISYFDFLILFFLCGINPKLLVSENLHSILVILTPVHAKLKLFFYMSKKQSNKIPR